MKPALRRLASHSPLILVAIAFVWVLTTPGESEAIADGIRDNDLLARWTACFKPHHAYISYRYNPGHDPSMSIVTGLYDRYIVVTTADVEMTFWRRSIKRVSNIRTAFMLIERISIEDGHVRGISYSQDSVSLSEDRMKEVISKGCSLEAIGVSDKAGRPTDRFDEVLNAH